MELKKYELDGDLWEIRAVIESWKVADVEIVLEFVHDAANGEMAYHVSASSAEDRTEYFYFDDLREAVRFYGDIIKILETVNGAKADYTNIAPMECRFTGHGLILKEA